MNGSPLVAPRRGDGAEAGFTLLEALVAVAILAMVIVPFLSMRTRAIMDAADAKRWRIAREIAERYLSELKAGARETPPINRLVVEVEDHPDFRYQILIGEAAIGDAESEMAGTGGEADTNPGERLAWQRDRENLREAQARGLSMTEYDDQLRQAELEERIPSEDELEDVAVLVTFPSVRESIDEDADPIDRFMLRAKISTMALEGLTPELAEQVAQARGGSTTNQNGASGAGNNPLGGNAQGNPGGVK